MVEQHVITALKQYGNTILNKKVVEKYGKNAIEDYLKNILNCNVALREVDGNAHMRSNTLLNKNTRKKASKPDIYYVAEVIY